MKADVRRVVDDCDFDADGERCRQFAGARV
jgi:hypothetical protein